MVAIGVSQLEDPHRSGVGPDVLVSHDFQFVLRDYEMVCLLPLSSVDLVPDVTSQFSFCDLPRSCLLTLLTMNASLADVLPQHGEDCFALVLAASPLALILPPMRVKCEAHAALLLQEDLEGLLV
jgi:hypothetical protein